MPATETYHFWTHGANTIPEYTKEYTGTDNGLYLRRAGWGAQIRQKKDTTNWFHLPLVAAPALDGKGAKYCRFWLRLRVNNDAVVERVHIRESSGPDSDCPIIYDSGRLNITGQDTELSFDPPAQWGKGPLALCVYVRFEGDHGEVVFVGAGVWFAE